MGKLINNLYELAQALGLPENTGETLTNQAAGWLYQHGVSATSGTDGLRLYPIGHFESVLLHWPITLGQLYVHLGRISEGDYSTYEEHKTPDGGLVTLAYDAVYIHDQHGNEIVMWIQDEWEEDPSVTLAITNAVAIALTKGVEEVAHMIGRRG